MKQKPKVFPIKLWAHDNGSFVSSPEIGKAIWRRVQNGRIWYGLSAELYEDGQVKLTVYDIACTVYGGLGPVLYELTEKVTTSEEKKLFCDAVARKQRELAEEILDARAREKRERLLQATIKQVFQ